MNADTVVPEYWLDRLHAAASTDADIASVTPLSNNATIMSLPAIGGSETLPYGLTLETIDAHCRVENAGVVHDVPTAHGFCMYIRRGALNELGLFDQQTFGLGYGEENDFSLRAAQNGWRNVVACDLFVQHQGSVSFLGDRDELVQQNLGRLALRYPFYHAVIMNFLANDPLHAVRNRVQMAVWRQAGPIVVVITLDLPGGAARHVEDMASALRDEGRVVVVVRSSVDAAGQTTLNIRQFGTDAALLYPQGCKLAEVLDDVVRLEPEFIHVQHLLDLPDGIDWFLQHCGIPYVVTLHDYFFGCPRVTLLDEGGQFCGVPDVVHCTTCLAVGGTHPSVHADLRPYARSGEAWREKWHKLLAASDQIIAPSATARDMYLKMFSDLDIDVLSHTGRPIAPIMLPPARSDQVCVAILGAIGPHKGAAELHSLVRYCLRWEPGITFVLIGHSDRDQYFSQYENVRLQGAYQFDELSDALQMAGCRVALFLSIWPETYSFTLSEVIRAGLMPVAFDIGAIGERMRHMQMGELVPVQAHAKDILSAIRTANTRRHTEGSVKPDAEYANVLKNYYTVRPIFSARSAPFLLIGHSGVFSDNWCAENIMFSLHVPQGARAIVMTFWNPPYHHNQACRVWINGRDGGRSVIAADGQCMVECDLGAVSRTFVLLTCTFDYAARLSGGDTRFAACVLNDCSVRMAGGSLVPVRLR